MNVIRQLQACKNVSMVCRPMTRTNVTESVGLRKHFILATGLWSSFRRLFQTSTSLLTSQHLFCNSNRPGVAPIYGWKWCLQDFLGTNSLLTSEGKTNTPTPCQTETDWQQHDAGLNKWREGIRQLSLIISFRLFTIQQLVSEPSKHFKPQLISKPNRCIFKSFPCVIIFQSSLRICRLRVQWVQITESTDNKSVFFVLESTRSYIQSFICGQI